MTRIKIDGITNIGDARWAAECGTDAIGFVFAESPRQVTPRKAAEIIAAIGPFPPAVGVFVNWPVDRVREAMQVSGCMIAQLHGDETEECVQSLHPYAVIKAIRVKDGVDREALSHYRSARAILLDTFVEGKAGGTGQRFDLSIACELVNSGWRVIVAGGLTPENVGEVVTTARPYGVDVSTGVEATLGRKDPEKVARFVAAVRAADVRRS